MDDVLSRVGQGISDVAFGTCKMIFSMDLSSETLLLATPVIGDIYMLANTFYQNVGLEHIGMQRAAAKTESSYVELNDKNAKMFFDYALIKVISYLVLGILSILPLVGAFLAATSTLSYALYVSVILTQGYFYNQNVQERERLVSARMQAAANAGAVI